MLLHVTSNLSIAYSNCLHSGLLCDSHIIKKKYSNSLLKEIMFLLFNKYPYICAENNNMGRSKENLGMGKRKLLEIFFICGIHLYIFLSLYLFMMIK